MLSCFVGDFVGGGTEFASQIFGEFYVESLVDSGEDLLFEKLLDDKIGFDAKLFRKLFNGDAFSDRDFAVDGRRFKDRLTLGTTIAEISFLILAFTLRPTAAGLGLMPALLIGCGHGLRLIGAQTGGMHRTRATAGTARTALLLARTTGRIATASTRLAWASHKRLTRTNRAAIKRLAGSG